MPYFFGGLLAAVILATVLPLARTSWWWIRVLDFPRLQIAVAGTAVLIGWWVMNPPLGNWDSALVVMSAIAVMYQWWRIGKYSPLARKQVQTCRDAGEQQAIKILVSNVLISNRQSGKLLECIRRVEPDVILAVEVDGWWQNAMRDLDQDYPFKVERAQENGYGMMLFSRLPLEDSAVQFLVESDVPSIATRVTLPGGRKIRLYGVHPRPPVPQENDSSVERDAELLRVGRKVCQDQEPALVVGDLNDVAWSDTTSLFQKVAGMLDPRVGRGLKSTFHADWAILRFPLDHVFVTPHFQLRSMDVLEHVGSDHFPILADVVYIPGGGQEEPEELSSADLEEEERILTEAELRRAERAEDGSEKVKAIRRELN